MPSAAENSDQHNQLRQRLEDELAFRSGSLDQTEYDWFLNSAAPRSKSVSAVPTSSIKPPAMEAGSKAAPPSVSTQKESPIALSRCRTTDLSSLPSRKAASASDDEDSATMSKLTRTATNVATSNVGARKVPRHRADSGSSASVRSTNLDIGSPPPQPIPAPQHTTSSASSSAASSYSPKKKGLFKRMFGKGKKEPSAHSSAHSTAHSSAHSTAPSSHRGSLGTISTATSTHTHQSQSSAASSPISPPGSAYPATAAQLPPPPHRASLSRPASVNTPSNRSSISSDVRMPSRANSEASPYTSRASSRAGSTSLAAGSSSASLVSEAPTLSEKYKDADPLLAKYLHEMSLAEKQPKPQGMSSDEIRKVYGPGPTTGARVQYSKTAVPPHPDQPKLPSAFAANPRFGGSIEVELWNTEHQKMAAQTQQASGMLGGFLKRTKTNDGPLKRFAVSECESTPPLNFRPVPYTKPPPKFEAKPPISELKEVKPMKKVAFATTTFVNDPPQQIPSRHPRKGNVEVGSNGELIIHKVTAEDKAKSTAGIVVGGSGHLRLMSEVEAEQKAQGSTGSETIRQEDKEIAAQKAVDAAGSSATGGGGIQKNIKIDTPMVRRKRQMEKPVVTLKIDELYTRCCHLREILPIPATLKQIPEGSTDPIPILKLKNPKPSMIEVLSFTDFIRIAPIICISLDGVQLSHDMLRLILSALMYKRYLEKVSLRNTPIDAEGWKMLCYFLSMNKALRRLDITQCPAIVVNTTRVHKKKKNAQPEVVRMECNMNDRSDMDWSLLTASIIHRGGLRELVLSGCKVPEANGVFKNLLTLALPHTNNVGLAYNELSHEQAAIVAKWLFDNKDCVGIDMGYNDLQNDLKPLIEYANTQPLNAKLSMISLNSCNLLNTNDTEQLFNAFSKLERLKFLDISNNKKMYPDFTNKLVSYLPLFNELARLNLDENDLDEVSMIKVCDCLPLIARLNAISLRGNCMNENVCRALCRALSESQTLFTVDFDKDAVPEEYQRKFGLLTMKNMERSLYSEGTGTGITTLTLDDTENKKIREELDLPEGVKFGDAMRKILKNMDSTPPEKTAKYMAVAMRLRQRLIDNIKELMKMQLKGELSLQGKELLVRLVNLDASVSKAAELINSDWVDKDKTGTHQFIGKAMENSTHKTYLSAATDVIELNADDMKVADKDQGAAEEGQRAAETSTEMMSDEAEVFKVNSHTHYQDNEMPDQKYKDVMMCARDPLDVLKMINGLKKKGMKLSDLYRDNSPAMCNSGSGSGSGTGAGNDDDGDGHSIGSHESTGSVDTGRQASDDKLKKVYDNVLDDIVKATKAKADRVNGTGARVNGTGASKSGSLSSDSGAPLKKVNSF